ncbi:MAG: phage portal protein [archaeon]|nr:phage portal protein [archaeon]
MGIFSKRKINKDASSYPKIARDYCSNALTFQGAEGTAFSCIDRIASEFAMLNFGIYNQSDKQRVKKHPLYSVLKEPNLDERHFNFFYQSAVDYFNGGAFWLIRRYQGEVISLFRLNPLQVQVTRDVNTNRRKFLYNGSEFTDRDIAYIPSRYGYSNLTGGSSIESAVPSVFQTSKSLELYTKKSYENGILGKRLVVDISGLSNTPSDEQLEILKSNMQKEYGGVENASRPLFKKKGIEYSELGANSDNRSAELSENRAIQKEQMSTLFGVAQSILEGKNPNEMDFAIFSEFAIRPMATQFQEVINSLLDEDRFYFEFDYNGIMKVSLGQRVDSYIKQINNGILSLDEVRAKENLTPIDAGDTHFMPVNMMPWNSEIKDSYMAKQKQIAQESQTNNPLDENTQHIPQGDDKQ